MEQDFIRERITSLRIQKGVSEYKMSLDLGHSKSYIQSISSGRALPSLPEFLAICDYFEITPKAFFDTEIEDPILIDRLLKQAGIMRTGDLEMILHFAERLNER